MGAGLARSIQTRDGSTNDQNRPSLPGQYRTIGTPVNMDAWYEAFNVKPGDKLYKKPEDRIKIW